MAHNARNMDTTQLDTPDKVDSYMAGVYYIQSALNADLAAVRRGCTVLVECNGLDWRQKQDFKLIQKVSRQILTVYPFDGVCKHYNTGVAMNIMASIIRQILPKGLRNRYQTGLTFEGGNTLDDLYLVPNRETASRRVLEGFAKALHRHYHFEKTFVL
ncbi:expressed unknown protein [Seminavis robusta]|uniref:Uncharacterized protein n=1 Tax=Seminavis robusta TaxID=568900 RepID=A0A9N8HL31_9STRA|nr:expressed unknown protein [Seminavis robusta]|eukprot:Sro655_g182230.1 n/a (158) ;mRNA; r:9202-9675